MKLNEVVHEYHKKIIKMNEYNQRIFTEKV